MYGTCSEIDPQDVGGKYCDKIKLSRILTYQVSSP